MSRLAVINVVGLSSRLLGEHMPAVTSYARQMGVQSFAPTFPALTCSAQSSMLTGRGVSEHGIVGNGWLDRESAEPRFWKQSNRLVRGEKIWHHLRQQLPDFTCANLFWWYNMATDADIAITPRPLYYGDGRKVFDIHTQPMALRESIKADLGDFPFPAFWGPLAGIDSSQWIANAAQWVEKREQPDLQLIYLPHLDYCLQQFGPDIPRIAVELRAIDTVIAELLAFFQQRDVRVLLVSEYGICPVSRPVHINRILRQAGLLSIKDEQGCDGLDPFMSDAIAIADHQIAHVYLRQPERIAEVQALLAAQPGIASVHPASHYWSMGIATERAGDLIAIAESDAWFSYYFWEDDARAPDYARCVDIHRKPGYDPAELFFDPALRLPKLHLAAFLLKKTLGLRASLKVIPLQAELVRGSHGRSDHPADLQAVAIGARRSIQRHEDIFTEMAQHFLGAPHDDFPTLSSP